MVDKVIYTCPSCQAKYRVPARLANRPMCGDCEKAFKLEQERAKQQQAQIAEQKEREQAEAQQRLIAEQEERERAEAEADAKRLEAADAALAAIRRNEQLRKTDGFVPSGWIGALVIVGFCSFFFAAIALFATIAGPSHLSKTEPLILAVSLGAIGLSALFGSHLLQLLEQIVFNTDNQREQGRQDSA